MSERWRHGYERLPPGQCGGSLSLGMLVAIWEIAAVLQLINTVFYPHRMCLWLSPRQAQFLMPQVGAEASAAISSR
jgi:hypothetical protein